MSIAENISLGAFMPSEEASSPSDFYERESLDFELSVRFLEMVETKEQLISQIRGYSNLKIITWFLGKKGLREDWFCYFRDQFLFPIREINIRSFFYLYDLRNWTFLKTPKIDKTIVTNSKVIRRIKSLNLLDISLLDSACYFQFLKESNDEIAVSSYISEVLLSREWIFEKSRNFRASGISLNQSFSEDILALQPIGQRDVNKTYSVLQYLEGYFLIQKVVQDTLNEERLFSEREGLACEEGSLEEIGDSEVNEEITILFLLPNDEYIYYFNEDQSFEEDVRELLIRQNLNLQGRKINILFIPFKWTENLRNRPYLSDGVSIKGRRLDLLDSLRA